MKRAIDIQANGFIFSKRPRMWLGTGIYFFQDAFEHSKNWAKKTIKRVGDPDDRPVVFEATINMEDAIDLLDDTHWNALKKIYSKMSDQFATLSQNGVDTLVRDMTDEELARDFDHSIDHKLVDTLLDIERFVRHRNGQQPPSCVRAAFIEGRPVVPSSWLFDKSAVIVSVSEEACIDSLRLHSEID